MPAKPSGKVKTALVNVTQKNGDIYVMERQSVYDQDKKYYRIISSKLIAKIPKGEKILFLPSKTVKWEYKRTKVEKTVRCSDACRNDGYHPAYWYCFRH